MTEVHTLPSSARLIATSAALSIAALAAGALIASSAMPVAAKGAIFAPAAARPAVPHLRDAARAAFLGGRHAEAYGRYADLADQGDAAAAQVALMLVCQGRALFGKEWYATQPQIDRWSLLAQRHVNEQGPLIAAYERPE